MPSFVVHGEWLSCVFLFFSSSADGVSVSVFCVH